MEHSFWQLGDELRGQSKFSDDHKWLAAASKLAEHTRSKLERRINLDLSKGSTDFRPKDNFCLQEDDKFDGFNFDILNLEAKLNENFTKRRINLDLSKGCTDFWPNDNFRLQEDNKFDDFNFDILNLEAKLNENFTKSSLSNGIYNVNAVYRNPSVSFLGNISGSKYNNINHIKEPNDSCINHCNKENITNSNNAVDKRFKTLPAAETLPRNEVLGGYIFVCNNDTMQEDLKRQLFGLPPRYRDSVRAITPGLPLFLYNYTTHQLHGIFEAATFGGSNIDPTAWEDKKCKGESRFPAQVRIRVRKLCKPLEEDAFRPVLHHYDGPKFRLELSVPETLDLLDLCEQAGV